MTNPTTPLPVQEPAGAVEAGKLAREALALLLDQRNRRVDQLSVGAGMAWAMAAEALTALASLPPVTQPDVSIPGPGMNASGERVDSANVMQANELAQAHEARRQAQANEERAKAALAGARIDLMRELREQGWSATTTQAKSEAVAHVAPTLLAAFRTTEIHGAKSILDQRFRMVFTFPNIGALHRADDEWIALTGSLSEHSSSGSSSGTRSSSASPDASQGRSDAASIGSANSSSEAPRTGADTPQEAVERQPLTDAQIDVGFESWADDYPVQIVGYLHDYCSDAFRAGIELAQPSVHGVGPATQEKQHG